ncbi:hypothetical protein GMD78_20950 [Ornithinibacillus sp. L9]|uniref:Spore cortex-lytic enzyme n=1 Tax=Ornithinibacillus caprae TaxID=2678566 RepID=A0A6N8FNM0_9BACI|nr:hypothetical protein [Ornithinibacillus caprae]MUK90821.1 hypothetical protein [Ornithinibacillus caprae]
MNDRKNSNKQSKKVKAYQEINKEIANSNELKNQQPVPQPKDFEEIEY